MIAYLKHEKQNSKLNIQSNIRGFKANGLCLGNIYGLTKRKKQQIKFEINSKFFRFRYAVNFIGYESIWTHEPVQGKTRYFFLLENVTVLSDEEMK